MNGGERRKPSAAPEPSRIVYRRMRCARMVLVALLGTFVYAKKKLKEQEIIQRTLKDYDWRVRPRGNNMSWPGEQFNLLPSHFTGGMCIRKFKLKTKHR
uniref:Uncharacterized protein n=1 Tax=Parascaris univalens TaxID=6257 RepID=A0A915AEI4_PARUN